MQFAAVDARNIAEVFLQCASALAKLFRMTATTKHVLINGFAFSWLCLPSVPIAQHH
jgi:hypothetical protein